jgi:hypothetical protein
MANIHMSYQSDNICSTYSDLDIVAIFIHNHFESPNSILLTYGKCSAVLYSRSFEINSNQNIFCS